MSENHPTPAPGAGKKDGAFSKLGATLRQAASDRQATKEDLGRKQAEDAKAAGTLVTSGVFGLSTVEIYDKGYVRVLPIQANLQRPGMPRLPRGLTAIIEMTPYERLRSISFTSPSKDASGSSSGIEEAVGPAVAKLIKGGKGLMKGSAPGIAMAGIAHLAGAEGRKAFLTIATDKQIHTLDSTNKGQKDVGLALADAGNSVLSANGVTKGPAAESQPATKSPSAPVAEAGGRTLADRLRELADLHHDGILSDEEFAAAKAQVLGQL